MGRLSKQQSKLHNEAQELVLFKKSLNDDEKMFVIENWDPAASHDIVKTSAFFTPYDIASHLAIETYDGASTVIDICAGIGILSYALLRRRQFIPKQIICIELCPDYAAVGRVLLPEATWIEANALEMLEPDFFSSRGIEFEYDSVEFISNPPFATVPKQYRSQLCSNSYEYCIAEIGMRYASTGTMLLPNNVTPWQYSGKQGFTKVDNAAYEKWSKESGLVFGSNCGIDTTVCEGEFKHTKVVTEIVNVWRRDSEYE